MRACVLLLFALSFFVNEAYSQSGASAKRLPEESYEQAFKREIQRIAPAFDLSVKSDTPVSKQVPVRDIDYSLVPSVESYDELLRLFQFIRDNRFLYTNNNPDFLRRISWLYPDDGCFVRSALTVMLLDERQLTRPAKIFAFGDLNVETPYSPDGFVSWWYHVSTVVRYLDTVYVFDPAINPEAPMTVDDWYDRMGIVARIRGVVCDSFTYDPFDTCIDPGIPDNENALKSQIKYLNKEWSRINVLGFDPNELLGDNPPWNGLIY